VTEARGQEAPLPEETRPMATEPYPIFVTESHGKDPRLAAAEFARSHFDKPRRVSMFLDDGTFRLIDGVWKYQVVEQKGIPGVSVGTYGIHRVIDEEE
jgi:hypothetical protein